MKIRGSSYRGYIIALVLLGLVVVLSGNRWIESLILLVLWCLYYGVFLWVKEIEISNSEVIIRRLFKATKIALRDITDVDLKKRTIIIYKGKYIGINLSKRQIHQDDRKSLEDYLKKYQKDPLEERIMAHK